MIGLRSLNMSPELRALVERRIQPFIDHVVIDGCLDLKLLFAEAYLRGLFDAKEAMKRNKERQ
jgi:hypothetical protein